MASVVVIFYGSGLFFAIMVLLKLIKYYRTPPHLRWEIYKDSSIYEKVNWWDHEHTGFLHKLKTIVFDILFQREYYRRNRGFWYLLMIFHVGLYLLILWHLWLFIAALIIDADAAPTWGIVWGHIATAIVVLGALAILIMRLTNAEMRAFYPRTHFFKWLFVIITLGGGFYAVQYHFEGSSASIVDYVSFQLDFSDFGHKFDPETEPAIHLLMASAWLLYLPFSHIMHVIFRFYHEIRWDHVPMTRGSALEKNITPLLGRHVSWADSHIQTGKTWGEVASGMPEDKPQQKGE
jgi:nitrate reductase gamma subunit